LQLQKIVAFTHNANQHSTKLLLKFVLKKSHGKQRVVGCGADVENIDLNNTFIEVPGASPSICPFLKK
jgi:hypothetical protein